MWMVPRALRIAVARTPPPGEGHAVLVVKTNNGDMVLDNRTNLHPELSARQRSAPGDDPSSDNPCRLVMNPDPGPVGLSGLQRRGLVRQVVGLDDENQSDEDKLRCRQSR